MSLKKHMYEVNFITDQMSDMLNCDTMYIILLTSL